jgi:hypothetical protein
MKPEPILHELAAASEAIRHGEIGIAIHHVGNVLLMLKAAQREAEEVAGRRGRAAAAGGHRSRGGPRR